jgi:hypothetical protein
MPTQPSPAPDPAARLAPRMEELRLRLEGIEPAVLADRTGSEFTGSEFRLHLWGIPVSLTLPGFTALDAITRQPLRPDQEMLLLYYFSTADGTPETGQWISFADLPGGRFYNQAFQGYTGHELVKVFGCDRIAFAHAAADLDGRPYPLGDAAFIFHALPRVALLVIFWQGEENEGAIDFPPSFQILFDASANRYLPTDACAILGSSLTRRLIAQVTPHKN